jgi:hypothetical protein
MSRKGRRLMIDIAMLKDLVLVSVRGSTPFAVTRMDVAGKVGR